MPQGLIFSKDDIEAICEAIDNSVARYSKDAKVMEYVTYYTDKYFDGEMTLDEAVNELQKTVKEYLNK